MAKKTVKTIDKNIDHDVELCRTTNARVRNQMMQLLVEEHIPFTQHWKKIPFFKREQYRGAKEICVILTHRNQYSHARRTIDQLDACYRERLMLHAV